MDDSINLRELCKLVGVKRLSILRWVKKGLPHIKQAGSRGGHPQLWFDRAAALSWVAANGSLTAGRKAAALVNKPHLKESSAETGTPPEPSPDAPSQSAPAELARIPVTIDLTSAREPGLLGNLERLKAQEIATSGALLRAKQANDVSAIVALSDRHIKETNTLAKLEQIALTYRTRIGELGPRHHMQGVFEKVITGVKNSVLGIPSTAVAQILPFLRNPEDAGEVRTILDKVTRDSLRTIAERNTRRP
jgi:hypothetical protein